MTKILNPNFEHKYFNDDEIIPSLKQSSLDKTDSEETINSGNQSSAEPKTVRCVIQKSFNDNFNKKFEGINFKKPKIQEPSTPDYSEIDKLRLENHLRWKKQKDEEYLQKKELERLEMLKKREEELHMEKIQKQKQREREEKLKEWQMQKAREKDERKREELMKVLEEEMKGSTLKIDKNRLLEEWVKLKNRQKHLESEKKAELQRKEEESKAVRQALAEISYRQWKEKAKAKMVALPKNGYQIFGPKPAPVVKEDWNNNFIDDTPEERSIPLRYSKSTTSNIHQYSKPSDDYFNSIKKSTSNGYNIKTAKSGTDVKHFENNLDSLKKLWAMQQSADSIIPNKIPTVPKMVTNAKQDFIKKNKMELKNSQNSKVKGWGDFKFSLHEILPTKKRIDLYLNGVNPTYDKTESDSDDNPGLTLTHRINSEFLYPPAQKQASFHLFNSPKDKNHGFCRNFSSDSSDNVPNDKKPNRRSRSHEKSTEKSSVPVPRVSSMPRTDKKSSEVAKTNISQSATSLARNQIINKQQLQRKTQKSFKGTRRKSKSRSPVRDNEKTRWKMKKNQMLAKKTEYVELKPKSEPKKLTVEVLKPKNEYLISDLSEDEKSNEENQIYKTYPLRSYSKVESTRNRGLTTLEKN